MELNLERVKLVSQRLRLPFHFLFFFYYYFLILFCMFLPPSTWGR